MNASNRVLRLSAQISLLIALVAVSAFLLLRAYIGDEERVFREGAITEVVGRGPVTIDNVTWQIDSFQPYTQLVDEENKPLSMDLPAGSVVILVTVSVTPREGVHLKDGGFTCEAQLRDDRGNIWKNDGAYGLKMPTYCADDDHPFKVNQPGKVAQVFVVPASAVPHLSGLQVEDKDDFRRVLLTR